MKKFTLSSALFITITAFGIIAFPALLYNISVQPLFMLSWAVTIALCMGAGFKFEQIQQGMTDYSKKAFAPISFMLCVGAMTGVWNSCGTIAQLTKLALKIITPAYFLPCAFILCLIFAFITGTAFGTCGTIGLALTGAALSFSIPIAIGAGAIISGTYFGYMLSPLSDYNNLVAGLSGKDTLHIIKHQAPIVIPSVVICTAIYYIQGSNINYTQIKQNSVEQIINNIQLIFKDGYINYIPILVVIIMLIVKTPTMLSILAGTITGGLVSVFYQENSITDAVSSMWNGARITSQNEFVTNLFSRGGMKSMSEVTILFLLAFGLVGIFQVCGIIETLTVPIAKKINGLWGASIYTFIITVLINIMSASGITSCVMAIGMLMPIYKQKNIDAEILSATVATACIPCTLLIPWHSNAINSAAFLGVTPLDIIPFMFAPFIIISVLAVFIAFKKIKRYNELTK